MEGTVLKNIVGDEEASNSSEEEADLISRERHIQRKEAQKNEEEEDDLLIRIEGNIQSERAFNYFVDKVATENEVSPDPRRWIVLATLWAIMVYINLAWVTFSPVADVVACYYGVNVNWINLLSWITMAVYIVGFFPSTWFLNTYGVKITGVLAGAMAGVAGWLRFAGTGADYFLFLVAGNLAVGVQNVLIWNSVSQISGMWFPPNERGLSTAVLGSLGAQVGILVGAVLGPVVVTSSGYVEVCNDNVSRSSQAFVDWQAHLYQRLQYYLLAQAIFATIVFLTTFPMPRAPKMPPSVSRTLKASMSTSRFFHSYLRVIKMPSLVFCLLLFGIFVGSGGAFMTLYDEILFHSGYAKDQKYASYLGASMQVFASIAVLAVGKWIDLTKSYHFTTVAIAFGSTLMVGTFLVLVRYSSYFLVVCIPVALTRGLVIAFQPVGLEYGAEITYPVPESISNGITNGFNHAWSMAMIIAGGTLVEYDHPLYCILMFLGIFLLGTIGLVFIRPELHRLKVDHREEDVWNTCGPIKFYRQRTR